MAADDDVVVVLVDRPVGNVVWEVLAGGTSLDRPPDEETPLLKDPRLNPVDAAVEAVVVVTAAAEVVGVTDKFGAPKFKVGADDVEADVVDVGAAVKLGE